MSASDGTYQHKIPITSCGRPGCIAVYKNDDCHFCKAAKEILMQAVNRTGISEKAICEIDANTPEGRFRFDHNSGLPAIRVCDKTITGIPDVDIMNEALESISCKKCFEDVT
jgi:hypothetical protein